MITYYTPVNQHVDTGKQLHVKRYKWNIINSETLRVGFNAIFLSDVSLSPNDKRAINKAFDRIFLCDPANI